jgi:hypothetical protein
LLLRGHRPTSPITMIACEFTAPRHRKAHVAAGRGCGKVSLIALAFMPTQNQIVRSSFPVRLQLSRLSRQPICFETLVVSWNSGSAWLSDIVCLDATGGPSDRARPQLVARRIASVRSFWFCLQLLLPQLFLTEDQTEIQTRRPTVRVKGSLPVHTNTLGVRLAAFPLLVRRELTALVGAVQL